MVARGVIVARQDRRKGSGCHIAGVALLVLLLHPAESGARQVTAVEYSNASRVARFENATRLSVGLSALYVVDSGVNEVSRIDPRTKATRSGGGGGDPEGSTTPVDVDAASGLTFLVADQSGSVHRYARDFAALDVMRILPERQTDLASIASVDERTIFGVTGDGSLFRWTRDRGSTRLGAGSGSREAAPATAETNRNDLFVQVVANARNVFALERSGTTIHVLDAFGGYQRAINGGTSSRIIGLAVSAGVLWLIRKQQTDDEAGGNGESWSVESYGARGERQAQVILKGFQEPVIGAAAVEGNLWVLTSMGLYVFDN